MRCFLYRVYDRLKSTDLVSKFFYYGQKFEHFEPIERTGTVARCEHGASRDGDLNFDIITCDSATLPLRWHCEVTPCQPKELQAVAQGLELGELVRVRGTRTWDPDHHIAWIKLRGGGNEVHPVVSIERV